jgi:hypothetical protein
MKARSLSAALAFAAAGCADARSSPPNDHRQILQAVLAQEASLPRERSPVCVALRTDGTAFDRDRERLRSLREASRQNTVHAQHFRRLAEGSTSLVFEWRTPAQGVFLDRTPRVEGEQAERLDAAARSLINGPAQPGPTLTVDSEIVPPPLRRSLLPLGCSTLTLSAPAFSDGIAFVETGYNCGGLCGNGWLYALEQRQDRWQIVAVLFTWVS